MTTDNEQPTLSPCPCCTGIPQLLYDSFCFRVGSTEGWQLRCDGCGLQTCWWHSKKDAIRKWNTRVRADGVAPVVDRAAYSELIHIAAELVRGDGFLSTCAEDMNPRLKRADILKTAEAQEQRLKDWADRVRRVADKLSPVAASPAAPLSHYEQELTVNWEATNARRHDLIAKKDAGLTEGEANELRDLQWLAGVKRELLSGPAPAAPQEDQPQLHDKTCDRWVECGDHVHYEEVVNCTCAPAAAEAVGEREDKEKNDA